MKYLNKCRDTDVMMLPLALEGLLKQTEIHTKVAFTNKNYKKECAKIIMLLEKGYSKHQKIINIQVSDQMIRKMAQEKKFLETVILNIILIFLGMKINGEYKNGVLDGNAKIKFSDGVFYDGEVQAG